MEKRGTRKFYVIIGTSTYDGINSRVYRITNSKKEAIAFFKWLYDDVVYHDYLNDEGEEYFNDRNYTVSEDRNDKEKISGNFWYCDDDGECSYSLETCYTNVSMSWNGINERMENLFVEYINR